MHVHWVMKVTSAIQAMTMYTDGTSTNAAQIVYTYMYTVMYMYTLLKCIYHNK